MKTDMDNKIRDLIKVRQAILLSSPCKIKPDEGINFPVDYMPKVRRRHADMVERDTR